MHARRTAAGRRACRRTPKRQPWAWCAFLRRRSELPSDAAPQPVLRHSPRKIISVRSTRSAPDWAHRGGAGAEAPPRSRPPDRREIAVDLEPSHRRRRPDAASPVRPAPCRRTATTTVAPTKPQTPFDRAGPPDVPQRADIDEERVTGRRLQQRLPPQKCEQDRGQTEQVICRVNAPQPAATARRSSRRLRDRPVDRRGLAPPPAGAPARDLWRAQSGGQWRRSSRRRRRRRRPRSRKQNRQSASTPSGAGTTVPTCRPGQNCDPGSPRPTIQRAIRGATRLGSSTGRSPTPAATPRRRATPATDNRALQTSKG
jgi:hypothetical protein